MLIKPDRYIAVAAVCMMMFSSCSTDDGLYTDDSQEKTPIEMTMGITSDNPAAQSRAVTRAVVTTDTPYGQSAQRLAVGTSLYMVMKSEKDNGTPVYTRTIGYAQEQATATSDKVKFATAYGRFWEDAHSRNSQLSAYAACVPGYYLPASAYEGAVTTGATADNTVWTVGGSTTYDNMWAAWGTGEGLTTVAWPLRSATTATDVTHQTAAFIASNDLCFSNNVSNIDPDPTDATPATDNRVTFDYSSRKFGTGHMVFYHALTWVTFRIRKGEGFLTTDPFSFSNDNENIVLKGFNTSGTFTLTQGEFTTVNTPTDIYELADMTATSPLKTADDVYVLDALMLPGTVLSGTALTDITFTIDGNLYHLTKDQLQTALNGETLSDNSTPALTTAHAMRPGVHYVFTLTVGKKKMDNLTASLVPWEQVSATAEPKNARIVLQFLQDGSPVYDDNPNIDLYRTANPYTLIYIDDNFEGYDWTTGYAPTANPLINKAQLHETATNGTYTAEETEDPYTSWYWPNNKTFYHFRMVMPKADNSALCTVTEDATNGDYIRLAGHEYSATAADSYTDVCWGAPFKPMSVINPTTGKLTYSTVTGFDNQQGTGTSATHQIQKGIGPTESTINVVLFHMMSDVTIRLTTTAGADAVDLDGATISLSNIVPSGKVRMGNGLVVLDGTADGVSPQTVTGTVDNTNHEWRYGFVPQDLANVQLNIQTADHNLYIVNMAAVVVATVGDNLIANPYAPTTGGYIVNCWYPNYKYTYTFNLTKSDISLITATLAGWHDVSAGNDNVQIQ